MNAREAFRARRRTGRSVLILAAAISTAAVACDGTTEPNVSAAAADPATPDPASGRVFTSLELDVAGSSDLVTILGMDRRFFRAFARDQYGVSMPLDRGTFSILSSDPDVIRVSESAFMSSASDGAMNDSWIQAYLVAVGPGSAIVSVSWTSGGVTRTASTSVLTVESADGWLLRMEPATLTLHVGSQEPLKAVMVDRAGNQRALVWDVLSVDRSDVVTLRRPCFECPGLDVFGLKPGEATITVKWDFLIGRATVTVLP